MAVLFDPKLGSDRVTTGATIDTPSDWTACLWMRKASTTGGQLFSVNSAFEIDVYYSSSTTDRLTIDRKTSGTTAVFQVTGANDGITYSASQWVFIAISQSGRATPVVRTASPVQAVALGSRTVTVANAGSGTALTSTGGNLYIGNWSGFDFALGGDIGWFSFHNAVLTLGEIEQVMAFGTIATSRVLASELDLSSLTDLSGNGHTLTNTGGSDSGSEPPIEQALSMQGGAAIVTGAQPTIVATDPAVNVSMQAASLTVTGGQPSIAVGAVNVSMQSGGVTVTGASHTITPGAVSVALLAGAVESVAGLPTILQGVVNVSMQAASLTITGANPSLSGGALDVSMQAGSLVVTGALPSLSVGAVSITLQAGSLTVTGASHTITQIVAQAVALAAGSLSSLAGLLATLGGVGPSPAPVIDYTLEVEWDDTGQDGNPDLFVIGSSTLSGAGDYFHNPLAPSFGGPLDDVTEYLRSARVERGRASVTSRSFTGRAEFVLHDPDGRFNPNNSSSPLAGDVRPGRMIRLRGTYAGVTAMFPAFANTQTIFQGVITRIRHTPVIGDGSFTTITASDIQVGLARQKVYSDSATNGGPTTAVARLLTDARVPLLDEFGDSRIMASPDTGYDYKNVVSLFEEGATVADVIGQIVDAERGQFYISRDGWPTYDARGYRTDGTASGGIGPDDLDRDLGTISVGLAGIQPVVDSDSIINRVTAKADGDGFTTQIANDEDSQFEFGIRDATIASRFLADDEHARLAAEYALAEFSNPEASAQGVELRMSSQRVIAAMLVLDLNYRVEFDETAAGGSRQYWVEGITHEATRRGEHVTNLTLSPVVAGLPDYQYE